jgi:hypothetical protein
VGLHDAWEPHAHRHDCTERGLSGRRPLSLVWGKGFLRLFGRAGPWLSRPGACPMCHPLAGSCEKVRSYNWSEGRGMLDGTDTTRAAAT